MRNILVYIMTLVGGCLYGQLPTLDFLYPRDAYFVAVEDSASLQSALDTYKVVRLEGANYTCNVTIKDNYELYGLPSTRLNNVYIQGGTNNAIVSNLTAHLYFNDSPDSITHDNTIQYIRNYTINIGDCKLENNYFLDVNSVYALTDSIGYMRNNTILRGRSQKSAAGFIINGNSVNKSYNNHLFFLNFLGGTTAQVVLNDQVNGNIIHVDQESPLGADGVECFNTDFLSIFGYSCYVLVADYIHALTTDAEKVMVNHLTHYSLMNSDSSIYLLDSVDYITTINTGGTIDSTSILYNADSTNVLNAFKTEAYDSIVFNNKFSNQLTDLDKLKIQYGLKVPKSTPWVLPVFDTVIASRRPDSVVINDHTAFLQNWIDTADVILLDSGVYYISEPLIVYPDDVIIGHGKGKTVIRALNDTVDMIQNWAWDTIGKHRPKFNLIQLSLEDGRTGIHYYSPLANMVQDDSVSILSTLNQLFDVEFYNMSLAGIHLDWTNYSYISLDNNLLYKLDFINCKYGIYQDYSKVESYSLVDKVQFQQCRFIGDSIAVYFDTWRANNNNLFVECLFKDNEKYDIWGGLSNSNGIYSCKFISPTVDKVIYNNIRGCRVVNTLIEGVKQECSILPPGGIIEGCIIYSNNSYLLDSIPFATVRTTSFTNNTVYGDVRITRFDKGTMYNNYFENSSLYSNQLIQITDDTPEIIIDKQSTPSPYVLSDLDSICIYTTLDITTSIISGTIDLSVSGGQSPYIYDWSNGQTTQDLTGLSTGEYAVIVTDNNGCSAFASMEVTGSIVPSTKITTGVLNVGRMNINF